MMAIHGRRTEATNHEKYWHSHSLAATTNSHGSTTNHTYETNAKGKTCIPPNGDTNTNKTHNEKVTTEAGTPEDKAFNKASLLTHDGYETKRPTS